MQQLSYNLQKKLIEIALKNNTNTMIEHGSIKKKELTYI